MKNNIGKQLVISAIVAIFIFGIGYALLNDTITVSGTASTSGTLDIKATSVSWTGASSEGAGTAVEADNKISINTDEKGVTIQANVLEYPGAFSTFTIELTNSGSLGAKVESITPTTNNSNMTFSYSNLVANTTTIAANGGTLTFTVTVGWLSTSTTGFSSEPFSLAIVFKQN